MNTCIASHFWWELIISRLVCCELQNMLQADLKNTSDPIGTFYVYMANSTYLEGPGGQTIIFDTISYDAGNDYSTETGIFHAPVSGSYVFHVTTSQWGNHPSFDYLQAELVVGSTVKMRAYGNYVMSGSAIVHVDANEGVYMQTQEGYPNRTINGSGNSHFLGFLLHADTAV